jgi:hypothetical protein
MLHMVPAGLQTWSGQHTQPARHGQPASSTLRWQLSLGAAVSATRAQKVVFNCLMSRSVFPNPPDNAGRHGEVRFVAAILRRHGRGRLVSGTGRRSSGRAAVNYIIKL